MDCDHDGFRWIDHGDVDNSGLSFVRRGRSGDPEVLIVCNFTPVAREDFRVGLPRPGHWRECLNTDAAVYGGSDVGNPYGLSSDPVPWNDQPQSARLRLPPLSTAFFVHEG